MKTTDILWENSTGIIEKHLNHPFSKRLADGSLPQDVFRFYLQQDAIYIKNYAQAMNILALKAPTKEIKELFLKLSIESYELEHIFQKQLFSDYQVQETNIMQPACLAYSSFLISTISTNSFLIGLTSLLPCFWVYLENGKNIAKHSVENNKYQAWIDTYVSQEFIEQTELVKKYVNHYSKDISASELDKLKEIFTYSCNLDYLFMDDAYKLRRWDK